MEITGINLQKGLALYSGEVGCCARLPLTAMCNFPKGMFIDMIEATNKNPCGKCRVKYHIRGILREDAEKFSYAFSRQGWNKPVSQFLGYFAEQERGQRKVFVAEYEGDVLGYVTLMPQAQAGPYAGMGIPEIVDFNVIKSYQGNGIGWALMDAAEAEAAKTNDSVCIGVGMHSGYGCAQRMYVKRGYIPDGSGVWYKDKQLAEQALTCNDDDLVLHLKKELKRLIR